MRHVLLAAVALLSSVAVFPVGAQECQPVKAFLAAGRPVFDVGGGLAFVSAIAIDLDGAPNAYHRRGRDLGHALDTLCNAGRARPGDGRRPYDGAEQGRCGEFLADVAVAEAAGWTGPTTIEWYGLATTDDARRLPAEQQDGPTRGFYVSTTALEDPAGFPDRSDPRRYLDSRIVPYVAVPRGSRLAEAATAGLGALVVSGRPPLGELSLGIVGDIGPKGGLGEASAAFANALRPESKRLAVERMTAKTIKGLAAEGPVLTVILAGAPMPPPYSAEAIRAAARDRFDAWGGVGRLRACARALGLKVEP